MRLYFLLPTLTLLAIGTAFGTAATAGTVLIAMAHFCGVSEALTAIENSAVLIAPLIPWCIACPVPLGTLGVGAEAVPFAFYLYAVSICYFLTKKCFFRKKVKR